MIHIADFQDSDAADFRRINLEWLDNYHFTETHDLMILDNPRGTILDPGGCLFMAKDGDTNVGSVALVKEEEGEYALTKMCVAPDYRGRGISRMLLDKCLERAARWKAKKITLFTSSKLTIAIALYEKYGFRHIPVVDSPFSSADVKMEKWL